MSSQPLKRVLITGSRDFGNNADAWNAMRNALLQVAGKDVVLIHGNAPGADKMAAHIWSNWNLPVEAHTAQWEKLGKKAGYVRNEQMVASGADVCIAFLCSDVPDGTTANVGTTHCINLAEERHIPVTRVTLAYVARAPYVRPETPEFVAETIEATIDEVPTPLDM